MGTVLRGRYRLTGTLKTGRVATVYRAEEIETRRALTVKVFHEIGRDERDRIQRFRRPPSSRASKAELPAAFVAVHDCDLTDSGQLFLVTESAQGPSVEDLVRSTPPLTAARTLELATRIGEVVEAAVNLGLMELPLAPGDIIVDEADRPKLLRSDVLIVRQLGLGDQLTAAESPERDSRYVSPEELGGLPATERSAVYRFGALLHTLLYGSPPFEGTTAAEVRDQQREAPPRRLRDRHQGVPASLDRLVSQMVDPDPMMRPADPTLILNELWDAACRFRPEAPAVATRTGSPSVGRAAGSMVRRVRPRHLALASLSVIVIGGTMLVWPYLGVGPSRPGTASSLARPATVSPSEAAPGPELARPPANAAPSSASVAPVPTLVLPPSGQRSTREHVATQGSSLNLPVPAPAVEPPRKELLTGRKGVPERRLSSAPGGASAPPVESPLPRPVAKTPKPTVAQAQETPSSARPAETPTLQRAAARPEPEPAPARINPAPDPQPQAAVAAPPLPPTLPRGENPKVADPGAIIEWLIQGAPRPVE